jgi:hypothetical protein
MKLIGIILVVIFLLTACSEVTTRSPTLPNQETPEVSKVAPTTLPTKTVNATLITVSPSTTGTVISGFTPNLLPTVASFLGDIPPDCTGLTSPTKISNHIAPGIGSNPVWAITDGKIGFPPQLKSSYGYGQKILWYLRDDFKEAVNISGANLVDNTPIWFGIMEAKPNPNPVLDPVNRRNPYPARNEFPSYIYIPKAGCYYLEAKWSTGSWRINIAVGRE